MSRAEGRRAPFMPAHRALTLGSFKITKTLTQQHKALLPPARGKAGMGVCCYCAAGRKNTRSKLTPHVSAPARGWDLYSTPPSQPSPLQGEGVRIQHYLKKCREVGSVEGSAAFESSCRALTRAHLKTCFGTTHRTLLFPPLAAEGSLRSSRGVRLRRTPCG